MGVVLGNPNVDFRGEGRHTDVICRDSHRVDEEVILVKYSVWPSEASACLCLQILKLEAVGGDVGQGVQLLPGHNLLHVCVHRLKHLVQEDLVAGQKGGMQFWASK